MNETLSAAVRAHQVKHLDVLFDESLALHGALRRLGYDSEWVYVLDDKEAVIVDAATGEQSTKRMWRVILCPPQSALRFGIVDKPPEFRFDVGEVPAELTSVAVYAQWSERVSAWNRATISDEAAAVNRALYEASAVKLGATSWMIGLVQKGMYPLASGAGLKAATDRPRISGALMKKATRGLKQ